MTRRTLAIVIAVPLMVGLWLAAAFVPVPFVTFHPGVTVDMLAESGGNERIKVPGHKTYHDGGQLRMTTVATTPPEHDVSLFSALGSWLDDDAAVQPFSSVYAEDETNETRQKQSHAYMVSSQDTSIAVALKELGHKVKQSVEVAAVSDDSPADGVLEERDRIVEVAGTPVSTPDQVTKEVEATTPGKPLRLVVVRDYQRKRVTVTPEEVDGEPRMGVQVGTGLALPFEVEINIDPEIGGPSAGLMFSLAIYDTLTPGPLTGNHHIAGTGTIDIDGTVGTIGGIQQKIAASRDVGAELFLVPHNGPDSSNCEEALGADNGDMRLVPVGTMDEALDVIEKWVDDPKADLPSCEDEE